MPTLCVLCYKFERLTEARTLVANVVVSCGITVSRCAFGWSAQGYQYVGAIAESIVGSSWSAASKVKPIVGTDLRTANTPSRARDDSGVDFPVCRSGC
jgi:hypothetical protein